MSVALKKRAERFTYGGYVTWPDDERWELIHGMAYDMSPAPSTEHQRVLTKLLVPFGQFFTDREGEVFCAPFDVRFPENDEADEDIETVVQPDIAIVCDPSKLDSRGCRGVPDIIIEIVSSSTAKKDRQDKFFLYEHRGVREYWIVHPLEHLVEVFALSDDGKYARPGIFANDDKLPVRLFHGLEIDLAIVFGIEREQADVS
jgi:Uma2 family endonuclease